MEAINQHNNLIQKIQSHLSNDLLKDKYKLICSNKHRYFGHCYVATETFYHSLPEFEKLNWIPQILSTEHGTHWFLKNKITNEIIDLTKEQFSYTLDYSKSTGCGFLTKNPSKRSLILMNRLNETTFHYHKLVYKSLCVVIIPIKSFQNIKSSTLQDFKKRIEITHEKCIIFNEIEFINNKKIIKDSIQKHNNSFLKKIHGRKCEIVDQIIPKLKSEFLNQNHIQGNDKSTISIGLKYNNELVSIMCFDTTKGINGGLEDSTYEISRYAVKLGTIVNGSFQKLLNFFIKNYSPKEIISFADKHYSNYDNIYIKNNFKLIAHTKPDFKYYDSEKNRLYHKLTYGLLYKKKNNLSIDEYNYKINTLNKIWNIGKLKYSMEFNENREIIYGRIYMITNLSNNKIYIGQTIRPLSARIYEYKQQYTNENKKITNQHLYNSFKKYGFDNFNFTVIDIANSIEDLNEKEIKWIKYYDSTNKKIGYNIELGGRNSIPSSETRLKLSKVHLGTRQSQEWINKRIPKAGSPEAKKYGKMKTDEEKKYLSEFSPKFWQGKTRSQETKDKISITKQGQMPSNCKPVFKIDQKTGLRIAEYSSTTEAARQNPIFTQSKISRICNNKAKSKENFTFSFTDHT